MPNHTLSAYVGIGVTLFFATVALVLRLVSRRMTKYGYGFEDVLATIAYVGAVGYSTIVLIWTADYGLGRTLADGPRNMSPEMIVQKSYMILFYSEFIYAFSIAFSQLTILSLYWRLFHLSGLRIPILTLIGTSFVWLLVRFFMTIFQCQPVEAFWDNSIPGGRCAINEATFFFATVLTHVVLDCVILLLPAIQVGRMHLPFGQKIAVIGLFMCGILVCMASIFVVIESVTYDPDTDEMPLDMAMNMIWAVVEVNLAIVSASLPLLRPVFRKVIPGSFFDLQSHEYSTSTHLSDVRIARRLKNTSTRLV